MRSRFPALLLALICSMAYLTAPTGAKEAGAGPQLPKGVQVERDIPYVPDGDSSQKLDVYTPDPPAAEPQPLLAWIHGGGWTSGNKFPCPVVFMVPRGYVVASIEYRFSQKAIFPAQAQDCQAAIRWLRANSKKYNIDPKRIGIWGDSAGGHLVALLGTEGGKKAFPEIGGNEDPSNRVQAVCDWFGPTDWTDVMAQAAADKTKNIFNFNHPGDPYSQLTGSKMGENPAKDEAVSPVHYVSKDDPPFLIMHGTHDSLVPFAQSVELTDDLKKAGVEVTLQPMPGSGHGGPAFYRPAVRKLVEKFFDKHLKGIQADIEPLTDSQVELKAPAAKAK